MPRRTGLTVGAGTGASDGTGVGLVMVGTGLFGLGAIGSWRLSTIVEIAVGMACLLAALGTWRLEGMRWISVLLGAAGIVAVGHALISLR